jgi:hypothetical protein
MKCMYVQVISVRLSSLYAKILIQDLQNMNQE